MIMRMARNSFPVNGGMVILLAARFALATCGFGGLAADSTDRCICGLVEPLKRA